MRCFREIVLQASTVLSNPPPPEAGTVTSAGNVPLFQLEQNIQALRTVVQAQQAQLKTLQELKESQPLVGLTTDQPWGMVLEGLSVGVMAMALGAGAMLAWRAAVPGRSRPAASTTGSATSAEFSDSMLYLAAQDGAQESQPPVTTHLHDPQQDAKASTLAHEDGDPALEYHRMALTAQGLSVTAGAGHVDSDRVPLDMPSVQTPPTPEKDRYNIFSPSLSRAEFDQRAAAEEVERVRRYLAQRRADRARNTVGSALGSSLVEESVASSLPEVELGAVAQVDIHLEVDTPAVSTLHTATSSEPALDVQWDDLLPSASPQAIESAQPVLSGETPASLDLGTLEHVALSDGASLLAALSEVDLPASTDEALPSTTPMDVGGEFSEVALPENLPGLAGDLLEWDLQPLGNAAAAVMPAPAPANGASFASDVPSLAAAHVQLALAQEFRDLGLWDEAKARVLEILEQPDTGQHAQAKALLEELVQTAPAPLPKPSGSVDPWL